MTGEIIIGFVKAINQQNGGASFNDVLSEMIWDGAEEADVIEEVFTRNQRKYNDLVLADRIEDEVLKEAAQQIYEGTFAFREIKDTLDTPVMPDVDKFDDEKNCAYALVRYCIRLSAAIEKELILRSAAVRNIHAIKNDTSKLLGETPKAGFFNIETHAQQTLKIASAQIIEALVWEITLSNNNPANPNRDTNFNPVQLREKAESNNLACMFAEAYEVSSDREAFMQRYNETMKDLKALYAQNTITLLDRAEAVLDKMGEVLDRTVGKTMDAVMDNVAQTASELNEKIPTIAVSIADKGIQTFKSAYDSIVINNFVDSVDRMTQRIADKILETKDTITKNVSELMTERIRNTRLKDVLEICSEKLGKAKAVFQGNRISADVKSVTAGGNSLKDIQMIRDKLASTHYAEQKGPFKDFIKSVKIGTEKLSNAVSSCLEMMNIQKEEQKAEKKGLHKPHLRADRA